MGKLVRFWLIYREFVQDPERLSVSKNVRFVSKMSADVRRSAEKKG
jgi:hypothetical protein